MPLSQRTIVQSCVKTTLDRIRLEWRQGSGSPDPHVLRAVEDSRQIVIVGISGVEEQLDCFGFSSPGRPKTSEVCDVASVGAADAVQRFALLDLQLDLRVRVGADMILTLGGWCRA